MTKIESFLDDIIQFLKKFFETFCAVCFFPLKFLTNISVGLADMYINPVFFTILVVFIAIIYYQEPASANQTIEQGIVLSAQRMADTSLFEKFLYTFPVTLFVCLSINIISRLFFPPGKNRKLLGAYFNYLFSTALLLFILSAVSFQLINNIANGRLSTLLGINYSFYAGCLSALYILLSSFNAVFKVLRANPINLSKFAVTLPLASLAFPVFMVLMRKEVQLVNNIYPYKSLVFYSYNTTDNNFYLPVKQIGADSFQVSINTVACNKMEAKIYLKKDGCALFYALSGQMRPIRLVIANNKDSSLIPFAENEIKFVQFFGIIDSLTLHKIDSLKNRHFDLYTPFLLADRAPNYITQPSLQPISIYLENMKKSH